MNALSPHTVSTTMMTKDEARKRVIAINAGMNNIRVLLLDFYEREGWKALGYASWRECVTAEFGQSQAYLYRQLQAAQIEDRINQAAVEAGEKSFSPIGENQDEDVPFPEPTPIPESHLRPLAAVPEQYQPTVYALAKETAPEGKLTAAHVERTVREVKGEKARPKKEKDYDPQLDDPALVAPFPPGKKRPPEVVQIIINYIELIKDTDPDCKESLRTIAVHVWNRQHRRGDV